MFFSININSIKDYVNVKYVGKNYIFLYIYIYIRIQPYICIYIQSKRCIDKNDTT